MSGSSDASLTRSRKHGLEKGERERGSDDADKTVRVSHACEMCREKRARCSGQRPTCDRCAKFGVECRYGLAKNDRRRQEIEDLQRRVADYEGLVDTLSPTLDRGSREKFLALRQRSLRADSSPRSELDQSSGTYVSSGAASLQFRSPPGLTQSGESGSPMTNSAALSTPISSIRATRSQVLTSAHPFASSDQDSPQPHKPSNASSQFSTPSLTNSVIEWQKGFLYTATEAILPPRDVTERAVKAFSLGSTMLFEFFETDELDGIFHTVYETPPSPARTIALCQLCITAAVGCQYDWDQFPDDTAKSYLAVAKLYVEEIIETHALSAMRVMALQAMYFSFEKRLSSLVYVDSGLSIARAQHLDTTTPVREMRKWKRTWCSLIFLSNWISATVGRYPDQVNHNFHPSMLHSGYSTSLADVVQLEMCKVALLTGRVLKDVYHAQSVDTSVINMYKAELESWLFSLPNFMRIESLLSNNKTEVPMRPIFLVHILYLNTMALIYRRVLSEFAARPESLISNATMGDIKQHLDACLWSARQVARILNVAILNGAIFRKCWMFIHGAYCANNILLYFAANKLLQNPASDSIGDDIHASEQCLRTLEHCAVADSSALHFLRHVKPLHIAISQMHMISRATAPSDVVPIASLIAEYLEAPRANIPVGDDFPQMQRSIVNAIERLLGSNEVTWGDGGGGGRGRLSGQGQDSSSSSSGLRYSDEEGWAEGARTTSAAESLMNYFWDDSLGKGEQLDSSKGGGY